MTVTGQGPCYLQLFLPGVCLVRELVQQILDHAVHLCPVLEHDQVAGGLGVLHPDITIISLVLFNSIIFHLCPIPALKLQLLPCALCPHHPVLTVHHAASTALQVVAIICFYSDTRLIFYFSFSLGT